MIKSIKGKQVEEIEKSKVNQLSENFESIVVDIGTGNGKFLYNLAKANPGKFFIGLDASAKLLEELSLKIYKKQTRGGLDNIIFVLTPIEDIPVELNGLASEIYVNFPWGSLLTGIIKCDPLVLGNIVNLAKNDSSRLTIYLTYDSSFEPTLVQTEQLPDLSMEFLQNIWSLKAKDYGIMVTSIREVDNKEAKSLTSWAKKILSQRKRKVYEIKAKVKE